MCDALIIGGITNDTLGRPLGPYRLRTESAKHGYNVEVIDWASTLSEQQLLDVISKMVTNNTSVIGFSISWFDFSPGTNAWATSSFFQTLKKKFPNAAIVIGGTKLTASSKLLEHAAWFLSGFSDISFVTLLTHLKTGESIKYMKFNNVKHVDSDSHYIVDNMDNLETVYQLSDDFKSHQPITIEIARGCIFKCAFCTHPFLGKKDYEYIRKPESIASELRRNYELFGTTRYYIADDTFNDSEEKITRMSRALELAKLPSFEFVCYIRPELLVTHPNTMKSLHSLGIRGAHLGIESLNDFARKSIGKGMNVNRVFDTVSKFVSDHNVKLHASFICGLPRDTEDDFYKWQEYLTQHKNTLFTSWKFECLGISKPSNSTASYSTIEKNPLDFGYRCEDKHTASSFYYWKNDFTDSDKCNSIATQLNSDSRNICRPGGWMVANCWFHGYSESDINTKTYNELNLYQIAKMNHKTRVTQNMQKLGYNL